MQDVNRLYYLDWLRVAAIMAVLFFHSAMPFAAESDWHIKNNETSNLFLEFNFFLSRFRMPLLFFISGAVAHLMLRKRTAGAFVKLRFQRLILPLIFGMLFIVPIQVYMERLNQGFTGGLLEFYKTIFTTGPYPDGNFSWHHLWFIAYLFVYDLLLAPLFKLITNLDSNIAAVNKLSAGKNIYLLSIPSVILFAAMVRYFPQTHNLVNDWCWFIYWLLFFVAGFLVFRFPSLALSLERNRRVSLSIAVATFFFVNYLRWNDLEPAESITDLVSAATSYGYLALYAITAWSWVFAIIGYGRRYLNKFHFSLSYLNEAAYPFYILHQSVIVVIAFYVVQTNDSILLKYIFLVLTSLITSIFIYHLFIRPAALLRFFMGGKLKNNSLDLPRENIIIQNNGLPGSLNRSVESSPNTAISGITEQG
ncbi:MAG: acyltransferase [Chitinophagaceae bacterium]|nr:MAG: acyltransferase [Chitinophagaceae bacterium]